MMSVGELGHAMESLLEAAAAQKVELGDAGVSLLERGFDRLHGMITRIAARRAVGMPEALIEEFTARAENRVVVAQEPAALAEVGAEVGAEAAEAPVARATAKVVPLKPLSAPINPDACLLYTSRCV